MKTPASSLRWILTSVLGPTAVWVLALWVSNVSPTGGARMALWVDIVEGTSRATGVETTVQMPAVAPEPPCERRPSARAIETDSSDTPAGANVEELLARLEVLAGQEGFHEPALSVIGNLVPVLIASPAARARIEQVLGEDAQPERIRGACLFALATALDGDAARELTRARMRNAPPEVERAGWLVLAALRQGSPGSAVVPGQFPSWTKLRSYPLVLEQRANHEELEQALERLGRPLPPEFFATVPRESQVVREEAYTREIVLLTTLATASAARGPTRDRMLRYAAAADLPDILLREAASHCLALASRADEELAQDLLQIAGAQEGPGRASLLRVLATVGGHESLILPMFRAELERARFADDPAAQDETLETLRLLLRSNVSQVRAAAKEMAVGRALDPALPEQVRSLLLDRLARSESDVLLDVGDLCLRPQVHPETQQVHPETQKTVIRQLGAVRAEQRARALSLLVALDRADLSADVRTALVQSVGMLGGADASSFLASVASGTGPEELRAEARRGFEQLEAAAVLTGGE